MIDRKIVIGIIVFIGLGFTIFSFANPLDNKDDGNINGDNGSNGNTEITIPEIPKEEVKDTSKEEIKKEETKKPDTKPITKPNTPIKKPTPKPTPPVEEPELPIYASFMLGDMDKNLKISRSKNIITITGTMKEKDPIPNEGIKTGSYLTLKISSPRVLNQEEIDGFSLKHEYTGDIYDKNALDYISKTEQSYFMMTQQFTEGKTIEITIDWGDGKKVTYSIKFNVTVTPKITP